MARLAFPPFLRVFKDNGAVCTDATATWYDAGTTTLVDSYPTAADADANTNPNTNPVAANSLGIFPQMWLADADEYKVVIAGTGITTQTIDEVYSTASLDQLSGDRRYIGLAGGAAYNTTGSANAYLVTTGLATSSLSTFETLLIKPNFTNSGAATLNVDGIGAKNIYKYGVALQPGELQSGQIYQVSYDGTQFQLLSASQSQAVSSNPNAIINGDMNIWQRGTSFAAIASTAYSADRFQFANLSAAVVTISRNTDVPTVAQAGRLFNYSLNIQVTTADAAVAAGDLVAIQQAIEGYNWAPLAQRTITYGAWCKAKKTGIYGVYGYNAGGDRSYVGETTINAADTWEYKTVTIAASPSAGTWDYTTGNGLTLGVALMCGSTFQTTANAWQTGNFRSTANQVNAMDNTANYFRTTGWKLEPGSVATMSQPKIFSDELAECQRYFYRAQQPSWRGFVLSATACGRVGGSHPVWMRTSPSVTLNGSPKIADGSDAAAITSISLNYSTPQVAELDIDASGGGLTSGRSALTYQDSTGGYFDVSAEL